MANPNEVRTRIKVLLAENNTTLKTAVELINKKHPDNTTTVQNVQNKITRQTIRFSEVIDIADVLGYDVVFKRR